MCNLTPEITVRRHFSCWIEDGDIAGDPVERRRGGNRDPVRRASRGLRNSSDSAAGEVLKININVELTINLCVELTINLSAELTINLSVELKINLIVELTINLRVELTFNLCAELTINLSVELTIYLSVELTINLCRVDNQP